MTRQRGFRDLFGNDEPAEISSRLEELELEGIIERAEARTGGRPAERFHATGQAPTQETKKRVKKDWPRDSNICPALSRGIGSTRTFSQFGELVLKPIILFLV
jgi:hypothetical protein